MTRALLLPLAVLLALATGLGLLGVAATVTQAPVVIVVTATATPTTEATPEGAASSETEPFSADVPVLMPDGPVTLRVARLVLAPGAVLPLERTTAPTALIAEVGPVVVWTYVYGVGTTEQEIEGILVDTVLRRGEHLVVGTGTVRAVRNAGPVPAVVLVLAIEAVAVPPEPDREMLPP